MRAQLMAVTQNGGSIFQPLFTIPEFTDDVISANDLSSVMWGDAIRADFQFKQFQDFKSITFPFNSKWVNLNTYEPVYGP